MISLADEILIALPDLMAVHADGPTISVLADWLSAGAINVRRALDEIEASERASVVRYRGSRTLHLVPNGHCVACKNCRLKFERKRKSKAVCCSQKCAVAWSWKNPETKARRISGIKKQRRSPEGRANTAERNRKLWSDPKQRDRLSKWNRERWADPETRARISVKIQAAHSTTEKRQFYADARRAEWADPAQRAKRMETTNAAKRTPEYRAKFSEYMKRRWQDPVARKKLLASVRRNSAKGATALRGRKQSPEHVQKRVSARRRAKSEGAHHELD